jgi:ABC-type transport system involved in multi-copper enzyme maturation permease subunit
VDFTGDIVQSHDLGRQVAMNQSLAPILAIARYTALEAIRTRYIWLVVALVAAGMAIAAFTGDLAITETAQSQAAITAAVLRLAAVLLVALFVTSSVQRDFSDKSVELMLSLPLPRSGYYLGKLGGYALVATVTAVPLFCLLIYLTPGSAALAWGVSLVLELVLVCAVSLLFAFTFGQVTAAISATLMFYLLGRSIAAIQLMAHGPLISHSQFSQQVMSGLVDVLSYLLPDLDQFSPSSWLLYPGDSASLLAPLAIQTLIYVVLISGVALFDLNRKNF